MPDGNGRSRFVEERARGIKGHDAMCDLVRRASYPPCMPERKRPRYRLRRMYTTSSVRAVIGTGWAKL